MKRRALPTVKEEMTTQKMISDSDAFIYIMVTATAVLSYWNSLNGEFVHDDIPAIVRNEDVLGRTSIKQLLLNDYWGTPMSDVTSHKSYRPLTTLSFRLTHAIFGLRPRWWHCGNVLLHAACCALVARAGVTVAKLQKPFAALAALLFAVHPIHTEPVAGVVGRADVLACIFFLSSLLVYHGAPNKRKVWLSILLGALSMLAKETGVTVLLLNLSFDFYRCWPTVKKTLVQLKWNKNNTGLTLRTSKVLVSLALLILLRLALLQGSLPTFSVQDNPAAFHPSFFVRLLTFCYLAAFNWWLLLCPWSLSHDWQLGSVPLITSAADSRNLLTFAAFGALLLLCYRCFLDLEIQRHTSLVIGVLLLTIPYVPASNLLLTVGFVIAERILYIPSVGSVILTAYGAQILWYCRPASRSFVTISLGILIISGAAKTIRRNTDWKDRPTLLMADLATLPHNAKLHYNFANYLRENEQPDTAMKHYKEALRLWPSYASAHNNLGTLIPGTERAEYHFLQAIKYSKYHVNAHYNLGKLYRKSGNVSEALRLLERCISIDHRFIQAYIELLHMKPDKEKGFILQKLVELEPENWEHYIVYGNWLKNNGRMLLAMQYFNEAMRISLTGKLSEKNSRGDLVSVRALALFFRDKGQRSRILQILTRWHTWRRGWLHPAASDVYLREWRLKVELASRARLYSQISEHSQGRKTCLDHSQLEIAKTSSERVINDISKVSETPSEEKKQAVNQDACSKTSDNEKENKKPGLSVSAQLKPHNKSDVGFKHRSCSLHRKEKNKTKKDKEVISPFVVNNLLIHTF